MGANKLYNFDDYKTVLDNESNIGDIFVTQLETSIENIELGLDYAKKKGMITVFNPAPAKQLTKSIYENSDYLIVK